MESANQCFANSSIQIIDFYVIQLKVIVKDHQKVVKKMPAKYSKVSFFDIDTTFGYHSAIMIMGYKTLLIKEICEYFIQI